MNGKQKWLWYAAGLIPAVWLGLLIAPAASSGLPEILRQFPSAMNEPLYIEGCEDSLKTVLVVIALYAMVIGVYLSTRRHYRRGAEHGSAKWGDAETVHRKYRARPPKPNKVFTQHIRMGLNGRKHKRNLNTVIIGGSGAGKTRSYAKPCLYEACLSPQGSSFVCLDPKGELLRDSGRLLEETGYEIRVLDLLHMEKSHCYNPFVYLTDDNEVQMLVTNLFKATTPKGSQTNDPFWDTTAAIATTKRRPMSKTFRWSWKCCAPVRCGRRMIPTSRRWMCCLSGWKCATRSISRSSMIRTISPAAPKH